MGQNFIQQIFFSIWDIKRGEELRMSQFLSLNFYIFNQFLVKWKMTLADPPSLPIMEFSIIFWKLFLNTSLLEIHFLKFTFWNSLFEIHFLKFTFWNSFFEIRFLKFTFRNSLSEINFLIFILQTSLYYLNFTNFTNLQNSLFKFNFKKILFSTFTFKFTIWN